MKKWFSKKIYNLLDKAKESALLAIDLYNKPKTDFRSGAYIVLMCIAWTSLLHAIFEKKKIKYYYKEDKIQKKEKINWKDYFYFVKRKNTVYKKIDWENRAWELLESAKFQFTKNSAIYKNIELFVRLRNKIEHRFMPEVDSEIVWECQAFILNFEDLIVENFWDNNSIKDTIFIPLQLSKGYKKIPISKDWKKVIDFIKKYRTSINDDVNLQQFSFKVFIMPNIWKNRKTSDLAVDFIKFDESNPKEMEEYEKAIIAIKSKEKEKFKPQQVLDKILEKTWIAKNMYWFVQMWKKYNVRPSENNRNDLCNRDYCEWDNKLTNSYLYYEKWIDHLIENEININL